MPRPPVFHIAGQAHFVSTNTYNFLPIFHDPAYADILVANLAFYRKHYAFKLLGYVVMPTHLHVIILPSAKASISQVMQRLKEYSAKQIVALAREKGQKTLLSAFRMAGQQTGRAKFKVWQDGFYDFNLYTEAKLREKLRYIHNNPVKEGLVSDPVEYPYSSCRNYLLDDHSLIEMDTDWFW